MFRDGCHGVLHLKGPDRTEVGGNFVADHGVHDAFLPGNPDDFPCIHAAQAGNAFGDQVVVQGVGGAEIGGRIAQVAHDIAEQRAAAFKILFDDAVVADQREGLGDDLAVVARIGQRFQVAFHARGEHELADAVDVGADAGAFKDDAVAEN